MASEFVLQSTGETILGLKEFIRSAGIYCKVVILLANMKEVVLVREYREESCSGFVIRCVQQTGGKKQEKSSN